MLIIKKALNSSVLLVEDDKKQEFIILGKGIGYGRRAGEEIDDSDENQIFMPVENPTAKRLMEMINSIPAKYFELTQEIINYATEKLETTFTDNIYLLLTDHLSFAVERYNNDIMVFNRVYWEIKNFYPKEFSVGVYALELLNKKFNVNLPEEEAANIAFHLVNAQSGKSYQHDAMRAAKLISAVVNLVKYSTNQDFDTESFHYSRFISHMQFFAERFFAEKLIDSSDDFLYEQIKRKHASSVKYAEKVAQYIYKTYNKELPKEEIAYLAVHIQRLISID